jgi:uncharacterized protein YbaR (Trm112 family)
MHTADGLSVLKESIKELQMKYYQGVNISEYLREKYGAINVPEIIEIAYDLQSGNYTGKIKNAEYEQFREICCISFAEIIETFIPNYNSILEAGVGEAHHLAGVIKHLKNPVTSYGFDISWSRIMFAKAWLLKRNCENFTLFTGDLLNIPCLDNSVDIVYTNHAIEPNGGNEEPILRELYRVAGRYLFLLEPSYELAGGEARERMEKHGYIKNLYDTAKRLGYKIVEYKLYPFPIAPLTPLNPTAIMVIEKSGEFQEEKGQESIFACPQFKTPLQKRNNAYFSADAMRIFPIIEDIPCLRIENSIIASKYLEFAK